MTTDQTPTRDRRILLAWLWYMALLAPACLTLVWLAGGWLAVAALLAVLAPVAWMQGRALWGWWMDN
jgi:uncharacterized membrane protein